jgi:hypothetical protein
MQRDPEVMREVEALMDDPEFQKVRCFCVVYACA